MKGKDEEGVAEKNVSLVEYINQVACDLKERVEHQRLILSKFLEDPLNTGKVIDYCILVDCGMRKVFGEFLRETIEVLEETRRSFRSGRLENLRKRAIEILENL